MLFKKNVDSDINLVFLYESLAVELFDLVDSDREYLNTWLSWPPHIKEIANFRSFIKNSIINFAEGRSMSCAIEYRGKVVGIVHLSKILNSLKKVEIGYWLSSEYQERGVVTRAVGKLIDIAFNDLKMGKVEAAVATEKHSSRRVCERLGFEVEGVIKNSENLHGRVVDHVIYGLYNEK